jgi:5-methylcytosine-specific restriction endonuclease McrBC GTP-binding regulatory subunit McrB
VSLFRPERETVAELPENRYAFVSVRPSWRDHTALLGHYDDELERYMRTPVIELLLRAQRELEEAQRLNRKPAPYFIILDEMNIAKIEHYFSDFLSALESRRYDKDGNISQEYLNLHSADATRLIWLDEQGVEYDIPPRLAIPTNVVFTGTVNEDDSTFDVSPKVVDRANTMEFSSVDFDAFLGLAEDDLADSPFEIPANDTAKLQLGDLELSSQNESQRLRDELVPLMAINTVLAPINMHFGYRVLNDAALYIRNAQQYIGNRAEVIDAAIDIQILQKILPKLFHCTDDRHGVLATMLYLCATGDLPESIPERERLLESFEVANTDWASFWPARLATSVESAHAASDELVPACYPRSAGKLHRMLASVQQ